MLVRILLFFNGQLPRHQIFVTLIFKKFHVKLTP